jgi:hypothetical protein
MKTLRHALLAAPLALALLTACNNGDGYRYPPVKLEFVTARANADGVSEILTDKGETFAVLNDGSGISSHVDTTLRIVTNYEAMTAADGRQGVSLYSSIKAVSPLPLPPTEFTGGIHMAPAHLTSIHMGRDYLNILLDIKAQNKPHTFAFVEERVETTAERRTVHLSLYHDNGGDVQAYSKRVYLSVPLAHYAAAGLPLTVTFSLLDYDGETKTWVAE